MKMMINEMEEYHLEGPSWTAWSTVLSLEPNHDPGLDVY
jgi:hypothetical protein